MPVDIIYTYIFKPSNFSFDMFFHYFFFFTWFLHRIVTMRFYVASLSLLSFYFSVFGDIICEGIIGGLDVVSCLRCTRVVWRGHTCMCFFTLCNNSVMCFLLIAPLVTTAVLPQISLSQAFFIDISQSVSSRIDWAGLVCPRQMFTHWFSHSL